MRAVETITISTDQIIRIGQAPNARRFVGLRPPLVMGVINVTPDSFSDGGRCADFESAVRRGVELVEQGADIIDIGGESTRPFADPVPIEEELGRTVPVIRDLVRRVDVPISIDTRHLEVARACIGAGASILNDVDALRGEGMADLVVETGVTSVIMHMKGTPVNMQIDPGYADVIGEVHDFLESRVKCLIEKGIPRVKLIVDPGIGFGKRVVDNLRLISELERFHDIGCPILVGASRKSFIGAVLDLGVEERLEGSLAATLMSVTGGASIVRVHDVKETVRALKLQDAISNPLRFKEP